MSLRYRMYPTPAQEQVMRMHCAHARYVWNLALEQDGLAHPSTFGRHPDQKAWDRELTSARKAYPWLAQGSTMIQQQALRDLRQAFTNWWTRPDHFGHPTWRTAKAGSQGFRIVALGTRRASRKWGEVFVPKAGWVRFRLSRPLGEHGSARVTLDRSGRWHVSFTSVPDQIEGPGDGSVVGIDRGVKVGFQASDGRSWTAPGLKPGEKRRLRLLQRKMARQHKGSNRRERTRLVIAALRARDADRRKDVVEKGTTELARTAAVVRIEDLKVRSMMTSAKGTIDAPGRSVRQKAGLNRGIAEQGWAMFAQRLEDKIGDRLERVPAAYTSQRCHECGHTERGNRESQAVFLCLRCGHTANADLNAALNIAAGLAVSGRGGTAQSRPPCEASTPALAVAS